jgi:hypothetical protein
MTQLGKVSGSRPERTSADAQSVDALREASETDLTPEQKAYARALPRDPKALADAAGTARRSYETAARLPKDAPHREAVLHDAYVRYALACNQVALRSVEASGKASGRLREINDASLAELLGTLKDPKLKRQVEEELARRKVMRGTQRVHDAATTLGGNARIEIQQSVVEPVRAYEERVRAMSNAMVTQELLQQRAMLHALQDKGDATAAKALEAVLQHLQNIMKERGVLVPPPGLTALQMRFAATRFRKDLHSVPNARLQKDFDTLWAAYRDASNAGKGSTPAAKKLGAQVAELRAELDHRNPEQVRESVRAVVGDGGPPAHVGTADDPVVVAADDTTQVIPEHDLPMPAENGPFYLMSTEGRLYGSSGKPSPADIHQGQIGDCYFLSSLSSLAAVRPDLIQGAIQYKGTTDEAEDGKTIQVHHYDVTLYKKVPGTNGDYRLVKKIVEVNDKMPVSKAVWDGNHFKQVLVENPRGVSWVALMEKAFAATDPQGYAGIGQGGIPSEAMEALTGVKAKPRVDTQALDDVHAWNSAPADRLFEAIQKAIAAGHITCTNTYNNDPPAANAYPFYVGNVLDRLNTDKAALKAIQVNAGYHRGWQYDDSADPGKDGLVQGHAYSILGTKTSADGHKLVTLRNPWGQTVPKQWKNGDNDDGTFDMPLEDFVILFGSFYESGDLPPPSPSPPAAMA